MGYVKEWFEGRGRERGGVGGRGGISNGLNLNHILVRFQKKFVSFSFWIFFEGRGGGGECGFPHSFFFWFLLFFSLLSDYITHCFSFSFISLFSSPPHPQKSPIPFPFLSPFKRSVPTQLSFTLPDSIEKKHEKS